MRERNAVLEGQLRAEAHGKDRKELQSYLKSNRRPATGTTAILRQAYLEARRIESGLPANAAAVSPGATSTWCSTKAYMMTKPTRKEKPVAEKRLRRYRSSCSYALQQRIDRASTQRLFLVKPPTSPSSGDANSSSLCREFTVLGSTGNVYSVTIANLTQCTCQDNLKGNICKHILFVMLKVVGLSGNSPLLYQQALLTKELKGIFQQLDTRMVQVGRGSNRSPVMANARVQQVYYEMTSPPPKSSKTNNEEDLTLTRGKRQPIKGEDCSICFDPLCSPGSSRQKESLVFCKIMCGANFHAACMITWKRQQRSTTATCPNCRSDWVEIDCFSGVAGVYSPEGYANLGPLQGQSGERDTSTYSNWYQHGGYHGHNRGRW